jgi:probable DNA metabolism protein
MNHAAQSVVFDGTFEGLLCVVHATYYEKLSPDNIVPADAEQLSLLSDSIHIPTDAKQAARVIAAMRDKVSYEFATRAYYAFLSPDMGRFLPLVQYIRLGFSLGAVVDQHLHEHCVHTVHNLARQTGREAHLLYGFCRFQETTGGVFYCDVTPKNDLLPLLADYFSRRFMNQQWVIHDTRRHMAAIYDTRNYILVETPKDTPPITHAAHEAETQELWRTFFNNLAIQARANPKLQRQMLPLYFRHNMTEFKG